MSLPSLDGKDAHDSTSPEVKALLRQWMAEARRDRLLLNTDFINKIENPYRAKSIKSLIGDGKDLSQKLQAVKKGNLSIYEAVKPYLQLVQENERDQYTGLKLSDIWRYFRLTWSTPYETTPGRTLLYLIRDAATPNHAVMGIASLENCAVQITCRDNYLGWSASKFSEELNGLDATQITEKFKILLGYVEEGISGIDTSKLVTAEELAMPTEETIKRLSNLATEAEQQRQVSLKETTPNYENSEKSDLGSISVDAENALYLRKRADQLSRLLYSKRLITKLLSSEDLQTSAKAFAASEDGQSAIRRALVAQKTKHIGSSMMELNVCGAIPPYNEILGGKLVALLALSPQIMHDYKERYGARPSEIASRLKGKPVCRPADLVYIGTTSLYYVGSSQYNRLKIPAKTFANNSFDLNWKEIGKTMGYGTMHISKATTMALTEATSDGYTKINHVFGEGASPKMRLMRMAINQLLETSNEDSSEFSKHAMSRIVYGACLAENTKEYLLGLAEKPHYYCDVEQWKKGTQKIIQFWQERWLASRINYEPVFERLENFDINSFVISNELKDERWTFEKLQEAQSMTPEAKSVLNLDFIRNFYRGSSAYADHQEENVLKEIHLKTKLDEAVLLNVKDKDIVLTGNPGDGKTHIIRVLKDQIIEICPDVVVETDASTLTHDEIYQKWKSARDNNKRFVIAINAAVLYNAYQNHKDFKPIADAFEQMNNCPIYHEQEFPESDVVVFDLSKRETLTKEILVNIIDKLTEDKFYQDCLGCANKEDCDITRNRRLLKNPLFQERLAAILKRVSLSGYHATLRELQSFVAYLIFGSRKCKDINRTNASIEYDLCNLVYTGKGPLFDRIRQVFDPVKISHPLWDEKLLSNNIPAESWIEEYQPSKESIAFDNEDLFKLRKRQFYFYNQNGNQLIEILDDDVSAFGKMLEIEDKKAVKGLIKALNIFFGMDPQHVPTDLFVWNGHRFDNEPRKILISTGKVKASELTIGRPQLSPLMSSGMETFSNYIRLERKDSPNIFLKVDFAMFALLAEAERGVPVLFMESNLVKKVWRFIEQLQPKDKDEYELEATIMDIQNKSRMSITIDLDDAKYAEIKKV